MNLHTQMMSTAMANALPIARVELPYMRRGSLLILGSSAPWKPLIALAGLSATSLTYLLNRWDSSNWMRWSWRQRCRLQSIRNSHKGAEADEAREELVAATAKRRGRCGGGIYLGCSLHSNI